MSSENTQERNEPAARYIVVRKETEKSQTGFLELERTEPDTVAFASKAEAEAYIESLGPDAAYELHDLEDTDEHDVPRYLREVFSSPEPDPEHYIRCRLDWINERLKTLGYHDLDTVVVVHPDGRFEPSIGQSLYPGATKTFMATYLANSADLNDEASQLAIVGELGQHALRTSDTMSKFYWGMDFAAKFALLQNNLRIGKTFEHGVASRIARHQGGKTTGEMKTAKKKKAIEIVRELIRKPEIAHYDPKVVLERVKQEIKTGKYPELLVNGKLPTDNTIKGWIEEARFENKQARK